MTTGSLPGIAQELTVRTQMPDEELPSDARVSFRPGWPSIFPHGLIIARSSVSQLEAGDDDEIPEEDDLLWTLRLGQRPQPPRLALLGELVVTNPVAFAGVTVVMPFELRDEPTDPQDSDLDDLLAQYGHWASSIMYDHAATAMRAALAGNGLPLLVPFGTPEVDLRMRTDPAEAADD